LKKVRVNITVDKNQLAKVKAALAPYGGKLSTLINNMFVDFTSGNLLERDKRIAVKTGFYIKVEDNVFMFLSRIKEKTDMSHSEIIADLIKFKIRKQKEEREYEK